jgi:iron complex transport system substrate-binding protein
MRRTFRTTLGTITAAIVAATTLAACGSSSPAAQSSAPASTLDFPATVGSLTLTQRPTHIVSLSPTATEMLLAINAGSQVVAVDDQSNFPANAPKTDLSGYKPNAEAIAKYEPDLVVISDDSQKIAEQLSQLKIPVYQALAATTLDDTYNQITQLGTLTGHRSDAAAEVTMMKNTIAKLIHDLPAHKPLTYYYELDQTYYSVTSNTFIGSLFSMAGLANIADPGNASNAYPQLSAEAIIKANPDLIFLADTKCCGQSADSVAKRAGWGSITAVKSNEVIGLDDDVASRWGPRVVDLLQAIAAAVAKAPVG